jgi:UDP-N-acetyl-2-amino-2-deoxyglucuronate dehydrogenase
VESKLQFAIIGCGRIGQRHAKHISTVGMLKAVCDVDVKKAKNLAVDGATAYASLDDLLLKEKDLNVIAICTPNGLHAEHSIKALNSDVHVLSEKHMALSVHDCC